VAIPEPFPNGWRALCHGARGNIGALFWQMACSMPQGTWRSQSSQLTKYYSSMKLTIAHPLFFAHLQVALLFSNSFICSLMCFSPVFFYQTPPRILILPQRTQPSVSCLVLPKHKQASGGWQVESTAQPRMFFSPLVCLAVRHGNRA
jgi:hypothetical protein